MMNLSSEENVEDLYQFLEHCETWIKKYAFDSSVSDTAEQEWAKK